MANKSLNAILTKLKEYSEMTNIAEDLPDDELGKIGVKVLKGYDVDSESREDWVTSAIKAMDAAKQKKEPKNFPFHKASNVKYPLITVAALQFGARAYPAIVDGQNIVKGQPIGDDAGTPVVGPDGMVAMGEDGQSPEWEIEPGMKRAKAERIGEHMSYQLTYEMKEWEEDTDSLLHHIPIVGCAFRKVWRDPIEKRNRSEMVRAMDLVVNKATKALHDCPRITHKLPPMYPHEVEQMQREGVYLDIELPNQDQDDEDSPHELLEQHCLLDLDKDGMREPYIVTVHKETQQVLRIVANYDFDEIEHDTKQIVRIPKEQYFVKYEFLPDPDGGFYGVGFGSLLESLSGTIDSVINQMIDAGTLQNAGGGFIGSGVRLKKGTVEFAPGRYTQVEAMGGNLRDAIYNFEHPGPSAVSFSVLELMLSAATDITGVKDIFTGDSQQTSQQTATTTLALIEQGMKVFTAIYKRIYKSLREEYKLLFRLNSKYLEDEEYFTVLDSPKAVKRDDYDFNTIDVMPVADPHMVTDMQRLTRAQAIMPLAEVGLVDPTEATRRYLTRIGEDNVDALLPKPPPPNPIEEEVGKIQLASMRAEVSNKDADTDYKKAQTQKALADANASPPDESGKMNFEAREKEEDRKIQRDRDRAEIQLKAYDMEEKTKLEKEKLKLEKLKILFDRENAQNQPAPQGSPNKKISLNYNKEGRIAGGDIKASQSKSPETTGSEQGNAPMRRDPVSKALMKEIMGEPEEVSKVVRLTYNPEGRINGAVADIYDSEGQKVAEQKIDMEYQDGKLVGAKSTEKSSEVA